MNTNNNVKIAILGYHTKNIGDEIQSIAALSILSHFSLKPTYIIDRDDYDIIYLYETGKRVILEEHVILIMNGYFMHGCDNFGFYNCKFPIMNDKIHPLFISTYLEPLAKLTRPAHLEYYRNNQPFFSRSISTMNTLRENGIDCEYFGCLTQLLDVNYINPDVKKTETNIFVDVANIAAIKKEYEIPEDAPIRILNHGSNHFLRMNVLQRFKYAKDLLRIYTTAKRIFTTRLHCFLPCRAMGLDVVYIGTIDDRTRDLVENQPDINWLRETFYNSLEQKMNEVHEKIFS